MTSGVVMNARYVLSDYIEQAMAQAVYDKLDDGSFAGRIPMCKGVVAFAGTLANASRNSILCLRIGFSLGLS